MPPNQGPPRTQPTGMTAPARRQQASTRTPPPPTTLAMGAATEEGVDADAMEDVEAAHDDEEEEEVEDEDDEDDELDDDDEDEDDEGSPETEKMEPVDLSNLREIGNLASWTVSTAKPGCGVEALRDEDTNLFWQSDGPQPHLLNIHFSRLVPIVHIRLYLDFTADESYTPTRLSFLAGMSHHDLLEFADLAFEQPKGWIDVDLAGVGGGADGDTLRAHLLQVRVAENHQNGKDTHVRGLQVFARDDSVGRRVHPVDSGVAPGSAAAAAATGLGVDGRSVKNRGGVRAADVPALDELEWSTGVEVR
ncbi:MAG: hypothetical protein M1825_004635 [Sarcosagium campestre]|nr:MAG: hypothetical protein M1825_004635 [Sarcosagium campestre]